MFSQMILPASTVRFMVISSTISSVGEKKAVASSWSKSVVLPVVARLGLCARCHRTRKEYIWTRDL